MAGVGTLSSMRLRTAALSVALLFALSACGSEAEEQQPAPGADAPQPASTQEADLGEKADALGWDCGEELVDGAGYTKRVCAIPDDLMEPGMSSNAIGLHGWYEQDHVDTYEELYLGDGVLVVGDGWFADVPTERVASAVREAIGD